ncbi:MAG TPA: hypothetical protein VFA68_17930 [Terriglobales bacterium]|nr:hypothetical protein [Terriglobales bacterium]
MSRFCSFRLSILLAIACCIPAAHAAISFTAIDVPGAAATVVYSINAFGDMVGAYQITNGGFWHAFKRSSGSFTYFDYPGAQDTLALGVNDSGQIVGLYDMGQGLLTYGFLYDGTTFTSIRYGTMIITEAWAINNSGLIGGETGNSTKQRGFELSGGNFTQIQPPGQGTYAYAFVNAINNFGVAVGFVVHYTSTVEGFIYQTGKYKFVDYPGATSTGIYGINDNSIMVGYYAFNNAAWYGFATTKGKFVSLTYPGATYTICHGLNNGGFIVGEAVVGSTTHGFVTTPIKATDFEQR